MAMACFVNPPGSETAADVVDGFYPIRPECRDDVPTTRFKPKAGKTLSARRWHTAFSQDGVLDIAGVLHRIERGGVHPSIKGVVWEFLLGCYDPKSTFDERSRLKQCRREQYGLWKSECQEMESTVGSGRLITTPIISEDGQPIEHPSKNSDISNGDQSVESEEPIYKVPADKKVIQWKLTLPQIGLDVVRTDRTLQYYDNQKNLARLWDILAVYAWVDREIGYCQGMSDLCSPMVIILEDEADAFWCFERLMRRLRGNFKSTRSSIGVQSQLSVLASIMKAVDPKLHQHLENLDGGEYLFAFRMLMVLFRREFSFVDALYLWELMWAMEFNPNIFSLYESSEQNDKNPVVLKEDYKLLKQYGKFERKIVKTGSKYQEGTLSIFLVASILEAKNKRLLKEAQGLDDVVKILNGLTGHLDAKKACKEALKLHRKYLKKMKKS